MSYPYINKWFFKDFNYKLSNLDFYKTIPFCGFSDLPDYQYPIIWDICSSIKFDPQTFVFIGKNTAPFGISLNPDNDKDLNSILNSCIVSIVPTSSISDTDFLLKSVLCSIIPICDKKHPFIKRLGLTRFSVETNVGNIVDKISDLYDNKHIYQYYIRLLGWKYKNQLNKWIKGR